MKPHQAGRLVRDSVKLMTTDSIPDNRSPYLILAETEPPLGYREKDYILIRRVNERISHDRLKGRNVVIWTSPGLTYTVPTLIAIALHSGATGVACFNPKRYWKRDAA